MSIMDVPEIVDRIILLATDLNYVYQQGIEEGRSFRSPTQREHELAKCLAAVDGELWAGEANTMEWAALRNHVVRARALIQQTMPNLREDRENAGD